MYIARLTRIYICGYVCASMCTCIWRVSGRGGGGGGAEVVPGYGHWFRFYLSVRQARGEFLFVRNSSLGLSLCVASSPVGLNPSIDSRDMRLYVSRCIRVHLRV